MGHAGFGLIISFVLLCISAIFSFSETALTVANRNKIIGEAERKNKKAGVVLKLLSNKDRLISTILFGNTLVNVLLSSLVTSESINNFGEKYIVVVSFVITMTILIFSEVLPKNLALVNPEKSSMLIASLLNFIVKIFYPMTFILQVIVTGFFKLFGFKISDNKSSLIGDMKDLISVYKSTSDEYEQNSLNMISGISVLNVIKVGQVMIHRKNVHSINIQNDSIDSILKKIINMPNSRIPIFDGEDDIVGILHVRDAFELVSSDDDVTKEDFINILHKPIFAYENASLTFQLNRFRSEHKHLAIVIDEYSVFLGIITLEDIIEKIVGSIYDEYDAKDDETRSENFQKGYVEMGGDVLMHDLIHNKYLNIMDYTNYTTLAGFIIDKIERIPEEGERFVIDDYIFTIKKKENNQIVSVIIENKKNN
jgi:Mg2+/Co2+ transporter CorB